MTAADIKKKNHQENPQNCMPWQSKTSKRWTVLCMSKSNQTLSIALSKALPKNDIQSPARALLTANGLILSSPKD